MKSTVTALCLCGAFTGLILQLFPSGEAGSAGRRAVSVCYLLEVVRLLMGMWKGGLMG